MKTMWNRLIRAIDIPFDPRDENSYQENIINSLINLGILLLLIYLIPGLIERGVDSPQILTVIAMIIFLLVSRGAVRRGKAELVSNFLVGVNWIFITTIMIFFENGLRAPAYMASMIYLIVYVGILHGRRSVILVTTLSILTSVIVGVMELQGIYLTEPKIPDIRWTIVAQIIIYPGVAFLITRTLRNLKLSNSLFREEAERRHQSELEVKKLNRELEVAYETTLEGWAQALVLRDKETEGHSRRVTDLSIELGRKLFLDEDEIRNIFYGALLHDIGKMGIPDEILNKPGPLSPEERAIIEKHPAYAFELLKGIDYLQNALSIPYSHHENWDGTGYPQGLQDEEIPLLARIFALVDNWDALMSDRPYRNAWSREKTIKYIQEQSAIKFDPQMVEVFLKILASLGR